MSRVTVFLENHESRSAVSFSNVMLAFGPLLWIELDKDIFFLLKTR